MPRASSTGLVALLLATLLPPIPPPASASPSAAAFEEVLDDHWANATSEQVFFRSDPDAWRMNGKLPEFSPEAIDRRRAFNERIIERLEDIDPAALDQNDRRAFELFRYERLAERESYEQPFRYFPITSLFGYHSYFADAPGNMAFLDVQDYEQYLVSLADFPRYNREHMALLRVAAERGLAQPCAAMRGYEETIARHVVEDPASSLLYGPFESFPQAVPNDRRAALARRAREIIADAVVPAYRELLDFYLEEYAPACRENIGITEAPGGKEYYDYLLRYFTTTDMTPGEIHELGQRELDRIRGEMDAIIRQVEFDGSFEEFLAWLRREPRFYARTEEELLGRAALIAKTAEGELPRFFTLLPRGTYNIKPNEGRGAYYVPSSGDGTTPGTYFVPTGDLGAQPLYTLEALTLHEGVPGHHLQTALAFELELPAFQRVLYHSAYGEGWGLYSERLGKEMGFYADPYSDFGRLTYEAWRACRLVVDTGMHAFGWSRDRAIRFMLDNTALSESDVGDEIDRYITWPAQALAYKIGEIRIRALRQEAEAALGESFDLRRFHDTVVGTGSVPIAVLEQVVREWIGREQGRIAAATR